MIYNYLLKHVLCCGSLHIAIGERAAMDEDNNRSLCLRIEVAGEDVEVKAIFASLKLAPWRILRAGRGQRGCLANAFPGEGRRCWTEPQCHDWRGSVGNTKELEVSRTASSVAL